eukprot:Gregarina_sp_Pseudo_9__5480@NODE_69_length_4603_cov_23_451358_g64_i0_p4_GENE_NODE_69_length_4603_cov_23_451358_g64_i0NODE_69_length_4603_cov_23_451358_g64_i0_p4_ORF_typecomplete_len328_score75_86_NODE_69_length_4603_cov_23_451358_g64_i023753358
MFVSFLLLAALLETAVVLASPDEPPPLDNALLVQEQPGEPLLLDDPAAAPGDLLNGDGVSDHPLNDVDRAEPRPKDKDTLDKDTLDKDSLDKERSDKDGLDKESSDKDGLDRKSSDEDGLAVVVEGIAEEVAKKSKEVLDLLASKAVSEPESIHIESDLQAVGGDAAAEVVQDPIEDAVPDSIADEVEDAQPRLKSDILASIDQNILASNDVQNAQPLTSEIFSNKESPDAPGVHTPPANDLTVAVFDVPEAGSGMTFMSAVGAVSLVGIALFLVQRWRHQRRHPYDIFAERRGLVPTSLRWGPSASASPSPGWRLFGRSHGYLPVS